MIMHGILRIDKVAGPPNGGVRVKTDKDQDGKVAASATKSQDDNNKGGKEYNLYQNNCAHAVVDVIGNAQIGIELWPAGGKTPNQWGELAALWEKARLEIAQEKKARKEQEKKEQADKKKE
jgi:hypothetical protein